MRFLLICFGLVLSVVGKSQINMDNRKLIGPELTLWTFDNGEITISDQKLDYPSKLLIGNYAVDSDTLIITKDYNKTKKSNPCESYIFCTSSDVQPLRYLITKITDHNFKLSALNSSAELMFEVLTHPNGMDYKEQKKFLKKNSIRVSDNEYMRKVYERAQNQDFSDLKLDTKLKSIEFSGLTINGAGPFHYFDLIIDSTGYFAARDVFVESGAIRKESVNYYQGKLESEEYDKLNDLYNSSGWNQISDTTDFGQTICSHGTSYRVRYRSDDKDFKKIGMKDCNLKSYMHPFFEFIITYFRQTKYQGEDHHYNFTKSLYKKK